jgi:hypothetical protein
MPKADGNSRKRKRETQDREKKPKLDSIFLTSLGEEPPKKKARTGSHIKGSTLLTLKEQRPKKKPQPQKKETKGEQKKTISQKPPTPKKAKQQKTISKQKRTPGFDALETSIAGRRPFIDPPSQPPTKSGDALHPSWKAKRDLRIRIAMTIPKGSHKNLEPQNRKERRQETKEGVGPLDPSRLYWSMSV